MKVGRNFELSQYHTRRASDSLQPKQRVYYSLDVMMKLKNVSSRSNEQFTEHCTFLRMNIRNDFFNKNIKSKVRIKFNSYLIVSNKGVTEFVFSKKSYFSSVC